MKSSMELITEQQEAELKEYQEWIAPFLLKAIQDAFPDIVKFGEMKIEFNNRIEIKDVKK